MQWKLFIILILSGSVVEAQELYVFTEPASNMPANSVGLKLNTRLNKMKHSGKWNAYNINPEVMVGVNRKTMIHLNLYTSKMFGEKLKVDGAGVYAKYRFYSHDDVHRHFRMAAYGKVSLLDKPVAYTTIEPMLMDDGNGNTMLHDMQVVHRSYEIETDGETSGLNWGVIATQLVDRFAVSATAGYNYRLNNIQEKREYGQPWHAATWSLSAGYLLLPKEYTSYKQTNLNVYLEFLGYHSIDGVGSYIDVAPAIQFIFNSIARLDLGYRQQLTGKGERFSDRSFQLKFEYDFLNVLRKK